MYYVFDLLYLEGYDLRRVRLSQRKESTGQIVTSGDLVRYPITPGPGIALLSRKTKRLEGILAKRGNQFYEERRTASG